MPPVQAHGDTESSHSQSQGNQQERWRTREKSSSSDKDAGVQRHRIYIFTMNLTMSIEFGLHSHTSCDSRTNVAPTVDFRSSGVVITGKMDDQAAELTPAPATETEQQHVCHLPPRALASHSHQPNYNTASASIGKWDDRAPAAEQPHSRPPIAGSI
jgi:hypothetical protein